MRRLATEGLTDPSKCKVEADRGYEDVEMGRCLKARASTEGYPKVPEDSRRRSLLLRQYAKRALTPR